MTPRERIAELVKQLREAAARQEPLAKAMVELVKLSSDEVKESLVNAVSEDMLRKQGAAQHLVKLHRDLTVDPLAKTPGARQ